jgi:hypothetical protein
MGVFARFGDHNFIASQQGDILWTVHMLTKEHPTQRGPREGLGEKALDSALTAAFARPERDRPSIVTRPVITSMANAIRLH